MMLALRRLLERASRWLLLNRPQPLAVDAEINRFRPIVQVLAPQVPDWLAGREADNVTAAADQLTRQGVPGELARRVSAGLATFGLFDVIEVAELAGHPSERVAQLYYMLSAHLDIERMLSLVSALHRGERWHALARLALRDDLYSALRKITQDVLHSGSIGIDPMTAIAQWEQENSSRLSRARATLTEISDAGDGLDLATLSVAVRALARL
jgi:glutamate dehydrogenase